MIGEPAACIGISLIVSNTAQKYRELRNFILDMLCPMRLRN